MSNVYVVFCALVVTSVVLATEPKKYRRGIVNSFPDSPADVLRELQKRNAEITDSKTGLTEYLNYFKFIRFQPEVFLTKRNIWQLPALIASKNISQECIKGFLMAIPALTDLLYGEIPFWPLHMIDSAGKSAIGSLRGTRRKRGNLHECINIDAKPPHILKNWTNIHYIGKFCHIIAEHGAEEYTYHMPNEVIPPKKGRRTLDTEICFPSLCTDSDVIKIVETFSNELIFDEFEIKYLKCVTREKGSFSSWTIMVIVICSFWAFLLLLGTAFDLLQEYVHNKNRYNWLDTSKPIGHVPPPPEHGRIARVVLAFSIPRNFGYLLDNPMEYPPDEVIPIIGGIRFFTFLWMHLITIYLIAIRLPWGNYAGILEDLRTANFQWIINGRFAVDTTICLSGFVSAYATLGTISREGGHFSFLRYYWRKIWRVTPAYLFVMMVASAFFWYCFDEGPEWITKYQFEDACKHHWWKGLLFINNFFSDTETCPPFSWYFAVHMQLHLIAPLVIYILYNKPRIGLWVSVLMIVTCSSIPALISSSQNLPFFIGRLFYFEANYQDYLNWILQMPYTHAGPFLIGILFGYMLYVDGIKSNINKAGVITAWITSVVVIVVTIYGFIPYTDGEQEMPLVLGLLYTTLAPSLWAAAIGWIIYACATGYGPGLDYVLSLNIFSNFNRLSYCCYLAQALTIKHFLLSRPDPLYYEPWMVILIVNGSMILAICGGIAISVSVERPCLELERALNYQSIQQQNAKLVNGDVSEEDEEYVRS